MTQNHPSRLPADHPLNRPPLSPYPDVGYEFADDNENYHFFDDTPEEPEQWETVTDPDTGVTRQRRVLSFSLDPQETSRLNVQDHPYRARFMAGKEAEHLATRETYLDIYKTPGNSHVGALDTCRIFAHFAREKNSGSIRVMASACRDRWCPMCAGMKAKYAKDQAELYIKSLVTPRFLTLTLKHNESDLLSQIQFLQDCFRRLRLRAYWKKRVTGGIWFLQVHRSSSDQCWHPHFHILLDGDSMSQGRLSELWEQVTFGSPIIDIRRIWKPEEAASYVARYSARPAVLEKMPLPDRVEIIEAMHGRRLCGTFGNAKSVTLTPPKIDDGCDWQRIESYDRLVVDAKTIPAAKKILNAYRKDEPISEELFELYTGRTVRYKPIEVVEFKQVQYIMDFYNTG